MIERLNDVGVERPMTESSLKVEDNNCVFEDAIFFDLEHYIYKKPICVGVFGSCFYDYKNEQNIVNNNGKNFDTLKIIMGKSTYRKAQVPKRPRKRFKMLMRQSVRQILAELLHH